MHKKAHLPSPAMVVALIALFTALSGTAVAAGIVAKAKFAMNSGKLQGRTAGQVAGLPGPASTAAGLVAVKTAPWSLGPGQMSDFVVTCDAGQKAVSGGYDDPSGWVHAWDSRPTPDASGWRVFITANDNAPAVQAGTLYAVCLK